MRIAAGVVVGVVVVALSGCIRFDAEYDVGHEPSATPLPTSTPSPPASARACELDDLEFFDAGGDAATGHRRGVIAARNVADDACTVAGYVDLLFLDSTGDPVPGVVEPGGGFMTEDPGAVPIVLLPQAAAMFEMAWDAVGGPEATASPSIALAPSGDRVELDVGWSTTDIAQGATVRVTAWQYYRPGMFDG